MTYIEDPEYIAQVDIMLSQPHLYTGAYEVDPSHEEQTLETAGKRMHEDVVVNAVNNQDKTAIPTESPQTIVPDSGYDGLDSVSVEAVPSTYVGSGITRRDSSSLSAVGPIVAVPKGYYESNASKRVNDGEQGIPVATKSAVSGHKVTITPSVLNKSGYIFVIVQPPYNLEGRIYGDPVTVKASDLVSGNLSVTENAADIDVTNYATVTVDVPVDFTVLSVSDDDNGTVYVNT